MALRKRLKEYEDAQAAADAAKLTDIEKLQKAHDATTKQAEAYRATIATMAIQLEAQRLGIVDPEVAATLIRSQLDFDASGTPTNAADLLKDLVKAKPYLVATQAGQQPAPAATAGGATNPSRSGTNGGAKVPLTWDYIDQLATGNQQEYLARRAEIQTWMLANISNRPRR
jgi:hypothetical protein